MFFYSLYFFPPPIHLANTRTILGALTQIILTAMLFPPFHSAPEQQQSCCRQRRAQRNEQQLHRQAQKHKQHTGKRQHCAQQPSAPSIPAHALPSLRPSYASKQHSMQKALQAIRPEALSLSCQGLILENHLPMIFGKVSTFASDTH